MNDLNEIFSRATQSDLDTEIAAAGELLQKVAYEQGVDLSSLSDDDVAELMMDLMPQVQGEKTAGYYTDETVTYADVAVELSKVAADNGVELTDLSREDYHAAFDAIAAEMASPDYVYVKQAEEEANSKLAEADAIGRYMARSYMDELEKISTLGREGPLTKAEEKMSPGRLNRSRVESAVGKRQPKPEVSGMARISRIANEGAPSTATRKQEVQAFAKTREARDKVKKYLVDKIGRPAGEAAHTLGRAMGATTRTGARRLGGATMGAGGLAAAGATAYGLRKLLANNSDKEQRAGIEDEALELARDYLYENGIDPDTGDKVASDDAAELAAEILRANGWIG